MENDLGREFWPAVRRSAGTVLRVGVLMLLVGWLGAEYIAHVLGGGAQPTLLTHVISVVFGVVLSYAAMMSVIIHAGMRGLATVAPHDEARHAADAPALARTHIYIVPQPRPADTAESMFDVTSAAS